MLRRIILVLSALQWGTAMAAPVKAITSFSILADMVHEVGGALVEVKSIVGPNGDSHAYQPTPRDSVELSKAQVVFVNGLGLDHWIAQLTTTSGFKGKLVVATNGIKTRVFEEDGKQVPDPHAWQDLFNGKIYVSNIAEALCEVDAEHCTTYQSNAAAYQAKLSALDTEVKTKFKALPAGSRQVVTTHDAFGYFAAAYDLHFMAPEGFATEAEPSAAAISKLVRQIKHDNIKALFFENMSDRRTLDAIAAETGVTPGPALFADALSAPGEGGETYLAMIQHNADTLVKAMAGN